VPDFRIIASKEAAGDRPEGVTLVEALIHRAEEIARRYKHVASQIPYRKLGLEVLEEDIAALSADLATATWKRLNDEVPSYAFAEAIGRRYREAGASAGALLLHWQIFRRAVHLVLADMRLRTGEGSDEQIRQGTLMNYALDWAAEASLVGWVISAHAEGDEPDTAGAAD
jgi:hypothetical protein